jgi:hypothetical protein
MLNPRSINDPPKGTNRIYLEQLERLEQSVTGSEMENLMEYLRPYAQISIQAQDARMSSVRQKVMVSNEESMDAVSFSHTLQRDILASMKSNLQNLERFRGSNMSSEYRDVLQVLRESIVNTQTHLEEFRLGMNFRASFAALQQSSEAVRQLLGLNRTIKSNS